MIILAGRYKGKSIRTQPNLPYRPTQSRIRKSLFDILADITGSRFLDLFAGSGIIGFEALSRGADEVVLVDQNPAVIRLLNENKRSFENSNIKVLRENALRFLKGADQFDIIFADPPYSFWTSEKQEERFIQDCLDHLTENGRYILEIGKKTAHISAQRRKDFGDTSLLFWSKTR